jgi:hypothetical protein
MCFSVVTNHENQSGTKRLVVILVDLNYITSN